ncbi:M14 family metallopeptidase [Polaribacter gochangensis]|uniref:M14 family metallopeptidase n=1 Tax=Polaribacter gochangensis TaxID=3252903 RepID=UPI00390490B2
MKRIFTAIVFLIATQITAQQKAWPEDLITVPVKTNYQKTSTYAEVMSFIAALQKESDLLHVEYMGTSKEGKKIPMVILANPKITTPAEAKASGKPVLYIQGNIHSGEVEGKEIVQQIMRDILLGDKKHLLDNQILIFAPIYNTDSNDKMKQGRRPSQEDSPVEVGIRANSQGLDLNRDGIKMEAFETAGLIQNVILKWDPEMLVDLHTTNGTWHGYGITYAPSYHYAGEKAPYDFTWNQLLPEVTKNIDKNYKVKIGPYGYYSTRQGWPPTSIYTYNHHPRYIVNQMGLRNKVGILSEAFAHDRLYERMNGTYGFVAEILEFTNKYGKKMAAINAKAEKDAIQNVIDNAGKVEKGVRFKMVALDEKIENYRTYDYIPYVKKDGKKGYLRSGKIIDVPNVTNLSKFDATVNTKLPRGYFLPKSMISIVKHLRKQGIKVTELKSRKRAIGEVFMVDKLNNARRKFEGHNMATVEGKYVAKTQTFRKGDFWIDMAQPLTNLAFYMLEPQSDDGLVSWNFFDDYLKEQGVETKTVAYPVFKYYSVR